MHGRLILVCTLSPAVRAGRFATPDLAAEPALREPDPGRWAGLRIADVARTEPEAFAAWLADPASAPHGGESLVAASDRVRAWLERQRGVSGETRAVVGPIVLRLSLCAVLGADPSALSAFDVEDGARVVLTSDGRRFRLRLPAARRE